MKKLNLRNQRNLDKRVRSHNNKKPNNSNRNNLNQRNLDNQAQFHNNKKPNNRNKNNNKNNLNLLLIRSSARNAINNIRQRQLLNNTKRYASNDINDNKKETTQCGP